MENGKKLVALSAEINEHHRQAQGHATKAIEHARQAGALMVKAKAEVSHGEWLPWLGSKCPDVTPRTAQRYMRIAKEWPALEAAAGANATHVSQMTIRDAVDHLTSTTARLAKLDGESLSRVSEISTDKPVLRAISEVNEQYRNESAAKAAKEREARQIGTGELRVYDQWAEVFEILCVHAEAVQGTRRKHLDKLFKDRMAGLAPYVPDQMDFVPDAVVQDVRARRADVQSELKRRINELLSWVRDQKRIVAEPLWTAAGEHPSESVLIGRRYVYGDWRGEGRVLDMRYMAVDYFETVHTGAGCDCGNVEPLNVAKIREGHRAA